MPSPVLPVRTDRLVLRAVTEADAEAIQAYRCDPAVSRFMYAGPDTVPDWRVRIRERWGTNLEKDDDAVALGVIEADSGELIGDTVLFLRSVEHRGGEVGFALRTDRHGRGYATEAARAMLRIGFEEFGMHRIVGRLDVRNSASAAVLERLGMRREAHLISNEWVKGEWTDEYVYALLEDEWRASRR
jgi:RimJ/RimL family protein N-acetyltransferase